MYLTGKRIIVGVTGGVAAYKIPDMIRRLKEAGAQVQVVMTAAAHHFIGLATLQAVSGEPVFDNAWDTRIANHMPHIDLSRSADAILIAPCSADFLAKLAHGLADDLLSTLCLAAKCPILLAPAMNREMWENRATQRNIQILTGDGYTLLGPGSGDQACGEQGLGRMLEPLHLTYLLEHFFAPKPFQNIHCVLTAGPTVEALDPVRVISNRSSGKMGYALARAAHLLGARVTLISGPTALAAPFEVEFHPVETAEEMLQKVQEQLPSMKIFISVAAVADWKILHPNPQKIKKEHSVHGNPFATLEWATNPDILATIAAQPNPPFCVGFAAESEQLESFAQAKRKRKNVPLLVGNLLSDALGGDTTRLLMITEQSTETVELQTKHNAAYILMQKIATEFAAHPSSFHS